MRDDGPRGRSPHAAEAVPEDTIRNTRLGRGGCKNVVRFDIPSDLTNFPGLLPGHPKCNVALNEGSFVVNHG